MHVNVRKRGTGEKTIYKHLLLKARISLSLRKPREGQEMCLGSALHRCGTVWPLAQLGAGRDGSTVLALLQGCCSAQLGRRKISPNKELQASVWPEVSLLTWPLRSFSPKAD